MQCGATGTAAASAVWVERSGTLVGHWAARGNRDAADGVTFDIDAPAAAASSFELTLPPGSEAQLDGGSLVAERTAAKGDGVYVIRPLGGRRRLRIAASTAGAGAATLAALRQDVDYEYSERGVDVTAQFRIDAVGAPLARLAIDLDPALTIVEARLADRRLTWTEATATKPGSKRAVIDFDPPLFGVGRSVYLRALAPAQVGKRHVL